MTPADDPHTADPHAIDPHAVDRRTVDRRGVVQLIRNSELAARQLLHAPS